MAASCRFVHVLLGRARVGVDFFGRTSCEIVSFGVVIKLPTKVLEAINDAAFTTIR